MVLQEILLNLFETNNVELGSTIFFTLDSWLNNYSKLEFDPGSGRTLAACLRHASRTNNFGCEWQTGE